MTVTGKRTANTAPIATAGAVARYVLARYRAEGSSLSLRQLHPTLWHLWLNVRRETGRTLFEELFLAMSRGPMSPQAENEFYRMQTAPQGKISVEPFCKDAEVLRIADETMERLCGLGADELERTVTRRGGAWDCAWGDGDGAGHPIPYVLVVKMELERGAKNR